MIKRKLFLFIQLLVFGLLITTINSCKKEEDAINVTVPLKIGSSYQGGKIAYIFRGGDPGYVAEQTHGLIAAVADQGKVKYGSNIITGATGKALGTGSANTAKIITNQGNTGTYAAKICRDYAGGGFNDWYLPSRNELFKLYLNRDAIGGFTAIPYIYYWCSTEYSGTTAYAKDFVSGGFRANMRKDEKWYVRAVRAF